MPAWRAEHLGGFIYLEGGYSNRNYRFSYEGGVYVLRAPIRPRPFVDRERELAFYRTAQVPDLPDVLAFDVASGRMITRWVEGPLLTDVTVQPEDAVDYLQALHRVLPATDRRYDPVQQARENLAAFHAPAWVARLADNCRMQTTAVAPCHNDLNPWNVILSPDRSRWITLDWEWFGNNDPLFDLVTLHQGLAFAESALPEMARALLGEPVSDGRLIGCLTAFWLREYSFAGAEVAAGDTRAELAEQRDLGESRLRALR